MELKNVLDYLISDIQSYTRTKIKKKNSQLTLWGHEKIYIFNNIKEKFIAAIFNSLPSPSNLTCHLLKLKSMLLKDLLFMHS